MSPLPALLPTQQTASSELPTNDHVQSHLNSTQHQPSTHHQQRNASDILKSAIEVTHSNNSHHESAHSERSVNEQAESGRDKLNHPSHQKKVKDTEADLEEVAGVEEETNVELENQVEEALEEPIPTHDEVVCSEESYDNNTHSVSSEQEGVKSYSDIVKRLAAQNAAKNNDSLAKPTGFKVVRSKTAPQTQSVPAAQSEIKEIQKAGGREVSTGSRQPNPSKEAAAASQLHSVYVNSLPENVSEEDLAALFSMFGKVVQVDLTKGRRYGFVKFDSFGSMQAALEYSKPLELNGATLQVEEKTSPKGKNEGAGGSGGRRRESREGKDNGKKGGERNKERGEKTEAKGDRSPKNNKNGDSKPRREGEKSKSGTTSGPSNNNTFSNTTSANKQQTKK
jgi:RNA recognition motif-containing protein